MQDDIKQPPAPSPTAEAAAPTNPPVEPMAPTADKTKDSSKPQPPPVKSKQPPKIADSHSGEQHIVPIMLAIIILLFLAAVAVLSSGKTDF